MANFQIQYSAPGTNPIVSGFIAVTTPAAGSFSHLAPIAAAIPTGWSHDNSTGLFVPDAAGWCGESTIAYSLGGMTQYTGAGTTGGFVTNFQTAWNGVVRNQYLVLNNGTTFTGNFSMGTKAGTGWIYIISESVRANTFAHAYSQPLTAATVTAGQMPKIVTGNQTVALDINGSSFVRFVGVDINVSTATVTSYGVVCIHGGAHHICFDRTVIRQIGTVAQTECARGIYFGDLAGSGGGDAASDIYILESRLGPFTSRAAVIGDTQPCYWANSNNNRLYMRNGWSNAASEAWMSGGGGTGSPTDLVIDKWHFYKPPAWEGLNISSTVPFTKYGIEYKKQIRAIVQRCKLDLLKVSVQDSGPGTGISVWSVDQNDNGTDPTAQSKDVHFRWCDVYGPQEMISLNCASNQGSLTGSNMEVLQCKFHDNTGTTSSKQCFFYGDGTLTGVRVEYCTGFPGTFTSRVAAGNPAPARFRNNIVGRGSDSDGSLNPSFAPPMSYTVFTPAFTYPNNAGNNQFAASTAAIQFTNFAGNDWSLAAGSPYKGDSSDGRDPGCDDATLQLYLTGVAK